MGTVNKYIFFNIIFSILININILIIYNFFNFKIYFNILHFTYIFIKENFFLIFFININILNFNNTFTISFSIIPLTLTLILNNLHMYLLS